MSAGVNWDALLAATASAVVVVGAALGLARHFIDARIATHVLVRNSDMATIKDNTRQLTTNGGTHLADDIKAIREWVSDMRNRQAVLDRKIDAALQKINHLEGAFEQYRRDH